MVTDRLEEPLRHDLQQLVAGLVPERVVAELEPVEVEEEHGERGRVTLRTRHGVRDPVAEEVTVGEPREAVVEGTVVQLSDAITDGTVEGSWVVDDEDIISKAGWSPYSGRALKGRIVATYLRGEEIARDGSAHDLRTGQFTQPAGAGGRRKALAV